MRPSTGRRHGGRREGGSSVNSPQPQPPPPRLSGPLDPRRRRTRPKPETGWRLRRRGETPKSTKAFGQAAPDLGQNGCGHADRRLWGSSPYERTLSAQQTDASASRPKCHLLRSGARTQRGARGARGREREGWGRSGAVGVASARPHQPGHSPRRSWARRKGRHCGAGRALPSPSPARIDGRRPHAPARPRAHQALPLGRHVAPWPSGHEASAHGAVDRRLLPGPCRCERERHPLPRLSVRWAHSPTPRLSLIKGRANRGRRGCSNTALLSSSAHVRRQMGGFVSF